VVVKSLYGFDEEYLPRLVVKSLYDFQYDLPVAGPSQDLCRTGNNIIENGPKLNNKKDLKKVDRPPTIFGWRIGI